MKYAGRECFDVRARWPAVLALLSVGGLHYALPPELRVGPDWLVLMIVAALAIPATISHHRGYFKILVATPMAVLRSDKAF